MLVTLLILIQFFYFICHLKAKILYFYFIFQICCYIDSKRLLLNMLQHVFGNSLQFNSCARQIVNKETPPPWRLLPKTCCSMFRRSRSTNFMCATLQAVCILNICKTFHEIQVPLSFLFKFTGINLVLVNIKPVKFHVIRLCSFCNIYMSNDVKFFETPCIYTVYITPIILKNNLKM